MTTAPPAMRIAFVFAWVSGLAACTDKKPGGTADVTPVFTGNEVETSSGEVIPCQEDGDCASAFPELAKCRVAVCRALEGVEQCVEEQADNGTACVDGLVCTGPDFCTNGACGGGKLSCDDQNPCTQDTCDSKVVGGCVNTKVSGGGCDDDNPCTQLDTCDAGKCAGAKIEACCLFAGECDDQDVCTDDACTDQACVHPYGYAPCNDADLCTTKDHCDGAGACGGTGLVCDDGNACTTDTCDPATGSCGSTQAPDGTACEDGNPCTTPDLCSAGLCLGLGSLCDCTKDAECLDFEDGDLCNGTLRCKDFECSVDPLTVIACNPAGDTACVKNTCQPTTSQCAPKAVADATACDDANPCTESDACMIGICGGVGVVCDDANACTFDGCSPESGCQSVPHTQLCDDDDQCTANDKCKDGSCGGVDIDCEDGDPCTTEPCLPDKGCSTIPNNAACSDGNPCTQGDVCENGACIAGVNTCQCVTDGDCEAVEDGDVCNGTLRCAGNTCQVDLATVVVCNKAADTACLENTCEPASGLCVPQPLSDGLVCDDQNPCTNDDACKSGLCLGGLVSCNDANPCTFDACSPAAGCTHVANNLPCDDADVCTDNDQCIAGYCVGQPAVCNDFNPCTNDACSALDGCSFAQNTAACEDGNPCTLGDTCAAGACISGGNACQCVADGDCVGFEDGDLCNGTLRCVANQCTVDPLSVVVCNTAGDTTCTKTVCEAVSGECVKEAVADALPCNDKSACSLNDVCFKGMCVGQQLECDDLNPCTDDVCDLAAGCLYPANTLACSDGNACTQNDTCTAAICKGAPVVCGDGNTCTDDACNPGKGCTTTPSALGKPCDDHNACTVTDHCNASACVGTPATCTDGNPCTADTCDSEAGCGFTALADLTPCDDGSACTLSDKCQGGGCGGVAVSCDDADPCTLDVCAPVTGCQYLLAANGTACDDGEVCTMGDQCKGGVCEAGMLVCDCLADPDCAELEDGDLCDGTLYCAPDHTCQTDPGTVVACDASEDTECLVATCQPGNGQCAPQPVSNGQGCVDADLCTQDEVCAGGVCVGGATECDDDNPCTNDGCEAAGGCFHQDNAVACDDGSKCTQADVCGGGQCKGTPIVCDDGNACTADACVAAMGCTAPAVENGTGCSDGNPCTTPDTCQSGACEGGPSTCQCQSNQDCADLEDGNFCNGTLVCDLGTNTCKLDAATVKACDTSGDTTCKKTSCVPATGLCVAQNVTNGTTCGDGNACNGDETCQAGGCAAGTPLACTDGNACTADACVPASGCQYTAVPNGTSCADSDLCDGTETCQAGGCTGGTALACNDNNVCTTNACVPATGCSYTAVGNGTSCTDGNLCNGAETCQAGNCAAGVVLACGDGNPCTSDSCVPASGCSYQNVANGSACSDGNVCNGAETCKTGDCKAGTALTCDDGNSCTTDGCDPVTGCKTAAVANGTSCADADLCDGAETCQAGGCAAGAALVCNDANSCTSDSCDPATGCKIAQVVNGTPCADANACNGAETCQAGVCSAGAAPNCNDSNVCTTDTCDGATGCKNTALPNGSACPDGTVCNGAETCQGGVCSAGAVLVCNDANPCTADGCNAVGGCTYSALANGASCSDADFCNGAETCQAGICTDQADPSCDDANPCTLDDCTAGACTHGPGLDGQPCAADANACTLDVCQAGACGHPSVANGEPCADDANSCTSDVCTSGSCTHPKVADDLPCATDNDACTFDSCQNGVCTHADNDPAPIGANECYPAGTVTADTGAVVGTWQDCGVADQFTYSGNKKTGAIDSWTCANPVFLYDGPDTGYEYTYLFVAPVTGTCTFFEYNEGVSKQGVLLGLLDWFILDGAGACGPGACLDYVWENKKNDPLCPGYQWCSYKTFAVTAGESFYLVGDQYDGNAPTHDNYTQNSDWEIEVKCDTSTNLLLFEDFTDADCDGCTDTVTAPAACDSFDWYAIGGLADITTGYYLGQKSGNTLSGYGCGQTTSTLTFPTVTLPADATSCMLSFDAYLDVDGAGGDCANATLTVQLAVDGGALQNAPGTACPSAAADVNPIGADTGNGSKTFTYDLSTFIGQSVGVNFAWAADATNIVEAGVTLDNVEVSCTMP